MAQSPSPLNRQPVTSEPPDPGASRITRGARQGWKLGTGVIVWDDGEKEMPMSGMSDEQKRLEAMSVALGGRPQPQQPGISPQAIDLLAQEAARLEDPERLDEQRRKTVADLAKLRPADSEEEARKRLATIPPSAAEQKATLRAQARALLDRELPRIEELKEFGMAGHALARDGAIIEKDAPQKLHVKLLEAIVAAETGDPARTVDALQELQRWTLPQGGDDAASPK